MKILHRLLLPAVLAIFTPHAWAGPLQQAAVNQIVNDVKVIDPAKGARPAALKEIIRDDLAVRTGIQSRTELLFQDDTLTRLGAETIFSFKAGTRDLSLDRGTMLLQVLAATTDGVAKPFAVVLRAPASNRAIALDTRVSVICSRWW